MTVTNKGDGFNPALSLYIMCMSGEFDCERDCNSEMVRQWRNELIRACSPSTNFDHIISLEIDLSLVDGVHVLRLGKSVNNSIGRLLSYHAYDWDEHRFVFVVSAAIPVGIDQEVVKIKMRIPASTMRQEFEHERLEMSARFVTSVAKEVANLDTNLEGGTKWL